METGLEYGLIGAKLGHSFSPEIHAKIGHYPYELRELSPEGVHQLLEERTFRGLNVTIPYKELVIPLLDEISDRARKIGAVNTIVNRNGRLYGDNTDYSGAAALIRHAGVEISGRKVLILGTGGTSKTLRAVTEAMGARKIVRVSRHSGEGLCTYEEAARLHSDAVPRLGGRGGCGVQSAIHPAGTVGTKAGPSCGRRAVYAVCAGSLCRRPVL